MDSPGSSSQANENHVPGDDPTTDSTNQTPKATPKTPKRNATPLRPVQVADGDTDESSDEDTDGEADGDNDAEPDDEQKPVARFKRFETKADLKRKKDETDNFLRSLSPQPTHYPKHYIGRASRDHLKLEPFDLGRQEEVDGKFSENYKMKCAFCRSAVSPLQDTVLIACHGQINGESVTLEDDSKARVEMSEFFRPCRSHFHQECAMEYNADNYCYQYAARAECQGRLLCPLHCCGSCDTDHLMQSSYQGDLMECALCLRAFHATNCYPVGGRDLYVHINIDGRKVMFEMMICPMHALPEADETQKKKPMKGKKRRHSAMSNASQSITNGASVAPKPVVIKKHINYCHKPYCFTHKEDYIPKPTDEPLIGCRTCIRSFHAKCLEVFTIDGVQIPADQCENCICNEPIHIDTPVVAYWKPKNEFWLAMTKDWYKFPTHLRPKYKEFERLGYTVVQWIEKGIETSFTIVPSYHVAALIKGYFKMATSTEKPHWANEFKYFDENALQRGPPYLKKVAFDAKVSKYLSDRRPPPVVYNSSMCQCPSGKADRCSDETCGFWADDHECPPDCDKVQGGCNNRRMVKGFINLKVELRSTDSKGYGLFAKEPISKGEFISEYVGEIIEEDEKKRRMNAISYSGDYQANHYMMELTKGWSIDATTYGNIARYINHSCSPNCITLPMFMFVKKLKKTKDFDDDVPPMEYERRIAISAKRDIEKGEELTFSYKMDGEDNLPACLCGAPNCNGSLGGSSDDNDKKKGKGSQKPKKSGNGGQNAPSTSSSSGQTSRGSLPPSTSAATTSAAKIRHGSKLQESKPAPKAGPSEPSLKSPKVNTPHKPSVRMTSVLKRGSAGNTPTSSPLVRGAPTPVFAVPSLPSTSSVNRTPKQIVASQDAKSRTTPVRTASVSVGGSSATRRAPRSVSVRDQVEAPIHQAPANNETPSSSEKKLPEKRVKTPKIELRSGPNHDNYLPPSPTHLSQD